MNPEHLKYLRSAIVTGLGAAGIGALIRSIKAKKERKKTMDFASSKDAIVIPVNKGLFLEGLPTPEEHKRMFGDSNAKAEVNLDSMSDKDLASAKREILKGRKFDFFGKAASDVSESHDEPDGSSNEKKDEDVAVSEEKIDGRVVFRGQDGKFVSKTDPVAVQVVEKDAKVDSWLQPVLHPIDFLMDAGRSSFGKPLSMTLGVVGSFLLAEKISDAINERRREQAKARLDQSREKYVKILEDGDDNTEKQASEDGYSSGDWVGEHLIGPAFLVPLALTALVTNKIIENRKDEKKKKKEISNSYPDEPIILYQTYDGKNMKIAADTALMAIMVKRALIEDAERYEYGFTKSAQFFSIATPVNTGSSGAGKYSDEEMKKAVDYALKVLLNSRNSGKLLDVIKRTGSGGNVDFSKEFKDMMPEEDKGIFFSNIPKNFEEIAKTPEFRNRLAGSGGLIDSLIGRFETDPEWRKYKDETVENGITDKIDKDWGFKKGGLLNNIIAWFMKLFGLGGSDFNDQFRNRFSDAINNAMDNSSSGHARPFTERAKEVALEALKKRNPEAYKAWRDSANGTSKDHELFKKMYPEEYKYLEPLFGPFNDNTTGSHPAAAPAPAPARKPAPAPSLPNSADLGMDMILYPFRHGGWKKDQAVTSPAQHPAPAPAPTTAQAPNVNAPSAPYVDPWAMPSPLDTKERIMDDEGRLPELIYKLRSTNPDFNDMMSRELMNRSRYENSDKDSVDKTPGMGDRKPDPRIGLAEGELLSLLGQNPREHVSLIASEKRGPYSGPVPHHLPTPDYRVNLSNIVNADASNHGRSSERTPSTNEASWKILHKLMLDSGDDSLAREIGEELRRRGIRGTGEQSRLIEEANQKATPTEWAPTPPTELANRELKTIGNSVSTRPGRVHYAPGQNPVPKPFFNFSQDLIQPFKKPAPKPGSMITTR